MRSAASALAALWLTASLTVLAGCTGGDDAIPDPEPSAAPSRVVPEPLARGVEAFATTSYRFVVTAAQGTFEGAFDPATGTLETTLTARDAERTVTVETQVAGGVTLLRIGGLPLPGFDRQTWHRLDPAKLRSVTPLGITDLRDPTGAQALLTAVMQGSPAGARVFAGTLDLTRIDTWGPVDAGDIAGLGARARAVPFTATLDGDGRVAGLEVTIPATGQAAANRVVATYRDFGAPVTVSRPPDAQVQDAPLEIYQLLGLSAGG